jgi:hypothetical protein
LTLYVLLPLGGIIGALLVAALLKTWLSKMALGSSYDKD